MLAQLSYLEVEPAHLLDTCMRYVNSCDVMMTDHAKTTCLQKKEVAYVAGQLCFVNLDLVLERVIPAVELERHLHYYQFFTHNRVK